MIQTGSKLTPGVHTAVTSRLPVATATFGWAKYALLARGMVAPLKLSGTADPLDMKRFKQFKSMVPTLEYSFSAAATCGEDSGRARGEHQEQTSTANPSAQVLSGLAKLWTGKDECTPLGSLETETVRPIDGGVDVVYGGGAPCERGPPGATH